VWGTVETSEGGHGGGGRAGAWRGRVAGRAAPRTGGGGAARGVDGRAPPGRHAGGEGRRWLEAAAAWADREGGGAARKKDRE
jgi:hypothetical protein